MSSRASHAAALFMATLLACSAASALGAPPTQPALRDELLAMKQRDQEVRTQALLGDFSRWREVDAQNQARLKEIVAQHGWPTYAMVGEDGARAGWLLAQHSDRDRAFQLQVLSLMEPLVDSGQASATDYAYLYDRTHYPQRYGTQGVCISAEEWQPFEIEDMDGLAERRKQAGMPPIADYAALFKSDCGNKFIARPAADTRRTVPIAKP